MKAGVHCPVPGGVGVAGQGVLMLRLGLVEDAQVGPGSSVFLVQQDSTDVGLESIHGLVLLLIQNSNGTPSVAIGLRFVHRVPVLA